jgi:HAD superfamily hydrolase (TIGR01509 family)
MSPDPVIPRKRGRGKRTIKALVFDFDGLIVDTEVPIFRAWQRIYREHGHELPLDRWLTIIGTSSREFDPVKELGDRIGENVDEAALDTLERLYYAEGTALQQLLPGVAEYLVVAHRLGLKTAIASSSTKKWVMEHLERFGIGGHFDAIVCREDVKNTKPDPELYRTALQRLGVQPDEAIALEDSTNGILAAKAAGLYCVVVPNLLTADLDLTEADLRLLSLEAMPLPTLLETVNAARAS